MVGRIHDPTVNAPQLEDARHPEAVVARLVAERQVRHLTLAMSHCCSGVKALFDQH